MQRENTENILQDSRKRIPKNQEKPGTKRKVEVWNGQRLLHCAKRALGPKFGSCREGNVGGEGQMGLRSGWACGHGLSLGFGSAGPAIA